MRLQTAQTFPNPRPAYHLERLPVVPPFFRKARRNHLRRGDLVYYGPAPAYYGIGEVVAEADKFFLVDFRGTGHFGVHKEVLEPRYLLPIPEDRIGML